MLGSDRTKVDAQAARQSQAAAVAARLATAAAQVTHLQAAAATGQAHLIHIYDKAFRPHGYHAAQILLTATATN